LRTVVATATASGLAPRIYGSLAAELMTGVRCLREASDVDLLFDWDGALDLEPLLAGLERLGDGSPRLDGEIRRGDGMAVAWRELRQATRAGPSARVLAKRDAAVEMLAGAAFMRGAG
jgi:phosphoribosyl-dephospho-CoA transferase